MVPRFLYGSYMLLRFQRLKQQLPTLYIRTVFVEGKTSRLLLGTDFWTSSSSGSCLFSPGRTTELYRFGSAPGVSVWYYRLPGMAASRVLCSFWCLFRYLNPFVRGAKLELVLFSVDTRIPRKTGFLNTPSQVRVEDSPWAAVQTQNWMHILLPFLPRLRKQPFLFLLQRHAWK